MQSLPAFPRALSLTNVKTYRNRASERLLSALNPTLITTEFISVRQSQQNKEGMVSSIHPHLPCAGGFVSCLPYAMDGVYLEAAGLQVNC